MKKMLWISVALGVGLGNVSVSAKDLTVVLSDRDQQALALVSDAALKQGGLGVLAGVNELLGKLQPTMPNVVPETEKSGIAK